MNSLPYQTKQLVGNIKDVDVDKGIVEGYFSAFGNKDADGDIIKKGAYSRTIKQNGPSGKDRIMHLLQHNPTRPLGKPQELREDSFGLFFRTKITDTTYGTDTLKLYKDGVYNEHSVGINIVQSDYSNQEDANVITEVKMMEGSTVTWGANENTPVMGMKSEDKDNLLDHYKALTKAFYNGDYTDDTFRLIESQRNHIETLLSKALSDSDRTTPDKDSDDTTQKISDVFTRFNRKQKIKELTHV